MFLDAENCTEGTEQRRGRALQRASPLNPAICIHSRNGQIVAPHLRKYSLLQDSKVPCQKQEVKINKYLN